MKWRFAIPGLVFAAVFGVFAWMLHRSEKNDYSPGFIPSAIVGKAAPQFRLPKVEDPTQFVDSKELAGRVYVVNVWGTWCGGCAQEHPVLLELARRNEVTLIGLNTKDPLLSAQRWLAQRGNPYAATALDEDGRAAIDWGVYGAPETFLVDANGTVLYRHIAPMTIDVWEREFIARINNLKTKSTT